jgi:PAS domain S-box-containing protein
MFTQAGDTADGGAGTAPWAADRRLHDVLDFLPDATFAIDSKGRVVAWNRAIEEMTGVPRGTMIGQGGHAYAIPFYGTRRPILIDFVGHEDPELEDLYEFAHHHGTTLEAEAFAPALRDGRGAHLWGAASPFLDSEGRPAGAIESLRDITERKSVEEERVRLLAAVEQSPDGLLLVDMADTILYVNAALEKLSGYDRTELLGQRTALLAGPDGAALPVEVQSAMRNGERWSARLDARTKDGGPIEAEWSSAPMRDANGNLIGYVGIARDRSAERVLEDRLRQAGKMEAVGRLAGGIAHDFNNLLAAIRGYTEFVAASFEEVDPRLDDLDQVLRAVDRAAELTSQLLAFGRRQVLQPRVIDPAQAVEEIVPLLRRLLGEDIALSVTSARALWHVMADPSQLEQVIVNLAVNARDAMPAGGRLAIEFANVVLDADFATVHPEVVLGSYVALVVSDSGTGMDADTLSHVFEPFFTTKAPGAGTGLGLASVYGIVKQSGGFVYVWSEPDGGTAFTIYLPRVTAPADQTDRADPAGPMPRGSGTLLLAEDDVAVRELARRVLEPLGYVVLVAGTAAEALALAAGSARSIDLLITDVVMPDMRGPALAAHLGSDHADLRVLLMSGYAEDGLRTRGELDPGVAFLAKPFTAAELARRVHEALQR